MRLRRRRIVVCGMFSFCMLSSRAYVGTDPSGSSPDHANAQFFLTAIAKDGSPAVLQESELSALVDKAPARVKTVRSAKNDPLLFAILMDVGEANSDNAHSGPLKEAVLDLFQRLATGQNQGYLVLFNDKIAVTREPIRVTQAKDLIDSVKFGRGTALYDAIDLICKGKLSRSENPTRPRRVIVLISAGDDFRSHVTAEKAEQSALEEGISVFSLVIDSSRVGPHQVLTLPKGQRFLPEISQMTSGLSTEKDFDKAISAIVGAIDAQWAVTLTTTQPANKKLHSLQTESTQKDVRISAPSSIFLE
jgi:hypothetical protein